MGAFRPTSLIRTFFLPQPAIVTFHVPQPTIVTFFVPPPQQRAIHFAPSSIAAATLAVNCAATATKSNVAPAATAATNERYVELATTADNVAVTNDDTTGKLGIALAITADNVAVTNDNATGKRDAELAITADNVAAATSECDAELVTELVTTDVTAATNKRDAEIVAEENKDATSTDAEHVATNDVVDVELPANSAFSATKEKTDSRSCPVRLVQTAPRNAASTIDWLRGLTLATGLPSHVHLQDRIELVKSIDELIGRSRDDDQRRLRAQRDRLDLLARYQHWIIAARLDQADGFYRSVQQPSVGSPRIGSLRFAPTYELLALRERLECAMAHERAFRRDEPEHASGPRHCTFAQALEIFRRYERTITAGATMDLLTVTESPFTAMRRSPTIAMITSSSRGGVYGAPPATILQAIREEQRLVSEKIAYVWLLARAFELYGARIRCSPRATVEPVPRVFASWTVIRVWDHVDPDLFFGTILPRVVDAFSMYGCEVARCDRRDDSLGDLGLSTLNTDACRVVTLEFALLAFRMIERCLRAADERKLPEWFATENCSRSLSLLYGRLSRAGVMILAMPISMLLPRKPVLDAMYAWRREHRERGDESLPESVFRQCVSPLNTNVYLEIGKMRCASSSAVISRPALRRSLDAVQWLHGDPSFMWNGCDPVAYSYQLASDDTDANDDRLHDAFTTAAAVSSSTTGSATTTMPRSFAAAVASPAPTASSRDAPALWRQAFARCVINRYRDYRQPTEPVSTTLSVPPGCVYRHHFIAHGILPSLGPAADSLFNDDSGVPRDVSRLRAAHVRCVRLMSDLLFKLCDYDLVPDVREAVRAVVASEKTRTTE